MGGVYWFSMLALVSFSVTEYCGNKAALGPALMPGTKALFFPFSSPAAEGGGGRKGEVVSAFQPGMKGLSVWPVASPLVGGVPAFFVTHKG